MLDFIPRSVSIFLTIITVPFRRLIMAFMGIMAVVNVYISRNNVNIAIIRMVNNTHADLHRYGCTSDHSVSS